MSERASLAELMSAYAAAVENGAIIIPPEFARRCEHLVRRGASVDLARALYRNGDATTLRDVESVTDAQLGELSEAWAAR